MKPDIVAVYPGSFDPVTNGHLDIIARGCTIFARVIVAVSVNVEKQPLFTLEERVEMIAEATQGMEGVEVDRFEGLLVSYAAGRGATVILRGIRAVTDFDYEFQMSLMNRRLQSDLETVFLVPAEKYTYLSSSLVKEVASLGGSVRGLVPVSVEGRLHERLKESKG